METRLNQSRLLGADFIRAAACLIVLAHHLAQRMSWSGEVGFMEWFRIFAQVGTFGVAMFFVLSGFLLARPFWQALDAGEPMPSLRTYALRRGARILPGFWLALWVTFALSVTLFTHPLDGTLVLRALAGTLLVADWHWLTLFPVEINGPLWSISMEVTSYALLPLGFLALFANRHGGWRARLLWLGVIAVALLAHAAFVSWYPIDEVRRGWDFGMVGGAKSWMPRFNPFGFFATFAIGALAAGVETQLKALRASWCDALCVAALAFGVWWLVAVQAPQPTADGWGWLGIPYGFPWFALAVALFLALAPHSQAIGRLADNRPVRYVARISFGIYVWHYVVLELVRLLLAPDMDHGKMADPVWLILFCALITGVTVIIAHLSYRYLEAPAIRWARGLERESKGAPTLSPAAG
jgi:peptidoglycan/LPS O-acetylase OafA/YrhL